MWAKSAKKEKQYDELVIEPETKNDLDKGGNIIFYNLAAGLAVPTFVISLYKSEVKNSA